MFTLLLFIQATVPIGPGSADFAAYLAVSDTSDLDAKIGRLRVYYEDALERDSAIARCAQRLFLKHFPEEFDDFMDIYFYSEVEGNLYDVAHLHVANLLPKTKGLEESEYVRKIVSLSKDGRWNADAPGYLHYELRKVVESDTKQVYDELRRYDAEAIRGFWFFYFDGAYPMDKMPAAVRKIQEWNREMFEVAKAEHEKSKKRLSGH